MFTSMRATWQADSQRGATNMCACFYATQQSTFGRCVAAYDSSFASEESHKTQKSSCLYTIREWAPELRLLQRSGS